MKDTAQREWHSPAEPRAIRNEAEAMEKIAGEIISTKKAVNHTPFERSLARRVAKAKMVLELATMPALHINGRELGLTTELKGQLERFETLNDAYLATVTRYVEAAMARKALFKGGAGSIKHVAHGMKAAAVKDKRLGEEYRDEIKRHYAAVFAQNPLAPPFDVVRPGFEKELDMFISSYTTILDHFRMMVRLIADRHPEPGALPCTVAECEQLIGQAEVMGKDVAGLIQKVYVVNDERLFVFERIKELCHAVCNRSRFLFGSQDPVYKEINTLKYAIM